MPVVDEDGNEKRRKKRVLPYVEDRRNILVVTLDEPQPEPVALSFLYALERGIEAAFELEDSELTAELLPPDDGPRRRMLFTEAAEGGAGVLRRIQHEKDALAKAARTALEICHFDPDTGEDLGGPSEHEKCARGCYTCLLTYANQGHHLQLSRHTARPLLLRLAGARTEREDRGESRSEAFRRLVPAAAAAGGDRTAAGDAPAAAEVSPVSVPTPLESDLAALVAQGDLVGWLKAKGYRLPDEVDVFVDAAAARPDLVFRLDGVHLAVFVDTPAARPTPPVTWTPATAWRRPAGTSCASRRTRTGTPSSSITPPTSICADPPRTHRLPDVSTLEELRHPMSPTHTAGSLVAARGREWVVLPESAPDMLVLRPLGGSEDDIAAVFPSFEEVRPAEFAAPSPDDLGDQRAAGLLRTALRIGFRSGAGPFRSLASIAVEPRAYQLVPLLMALRQRTVRLLISDDVGIGKTVEAGLIAKELLAQGEATRLAVPRSPALAEQWQAELREKFGIDAELVLASTVSRLERNLELGQSLFDKHPFTIISTDFIKSTRHREDFVKHCPDLVIVDEAHTGC
ncbi:RNA polymerase-associated protein RapA [Streptomyces griseoloalbus]